jgi:hypothetical protein
LDEDGWNALTTIPTPVGPESYGRVDGRAQAVDDFCGQEPTATIRLDGLQFTRLAGGRSLCPACAKDSELGGDADVAEQIVEHLNFVI